MQVEPGTPSFPPPSAAAPLAAPSDAAPSDGLDRVKGAVLASHLGIFLLAVILPLILRLTEGERNAFVRHHSTEALNFQLSVAIAGIANLIGGLIFGLVFSPLFFVLMFLVHAVIGITAVVLSIVAAVAGNRGEWYRYPISVRFVRGAAAHG